MKKNLLLSIAVVLTCCFLPACELPQEKIVHTYTNYLSMIEGLSSIAMDQAYLRSTNETSNDVKEMLHQEAPTLNIAVINKVLTTLQCAKEYKVQHNFILTVIDYSLPSNEKRLWVFDIKEKKLLFYTYVSHGIKSGSLLSNFFSNKHNSKTSSIGVYTTEKAYYGREGLSLVLEGLDKGFNDNALSRAVVMHSGWYVDEQFIKKYGRAGRSWGCPALPPDLAAPIINTIKDKSLFVIYYPSDSWFLKSKFLNCAHFSSQPSLTSASAVLTPVEENELREDIIFADLNKNNKYDETKPIVVMRADSYEREFHIKAPLNRMLRRQIDHMEYIALTNTEFNNLVIPSENKEILNEIYFVIPIVKMHRGYYATEMKIVSLGKIKDVRFNINSLNQTDPKSYTLNLEEKPFVSLKSTNRFIRWLGL